MNVIIANKLNDALSTLNIDVIKKLTGEFEVESITSTFANFYFNRMIIDITAIKNHFDINEMQKLSANLDSSKIILYLDDDPRITNSYLSKIISLGIYNFTRELTGITYLMDNPNSYRDVAQYHDLAHEDEVKNTPQNVNVTVNQVPFGAVNNNQVEQNFQTTQQNQNFGNFNYTSYNAFMPSSLVIGFKDLTPGAGSTTLVYMLKKQLASSKKVLAVQLNDNDFTYFKDSELLSTNTSQYNNVRTKFANFDVVLIDLNNSSLDIDKTCNDIIYLLEPSTIKLNALLRRDKSALAKLKNNKIVLNNSLLTQSDVARFEFEGNVKIFYNIPPLDERKNEQMVLESFLAKMGIGSSNYNQDTQSGNNGGGLFSNLFKKN